MTGINPKDRPLVSIGLPVYNSQSYLKKAIESILAQDYPHFELIIADDVSEDNTIEICQSFSDQRIRFFKNEKNLGSHPNHQRVLDLAIGEYFIWASDDDLWSVSFITDLLQGLNDNPEVILAYPTQYNIDESDKIIRDYPHLDDLQKGNTLFERLHYFLWFEEVNGKANLVHGLIPMKVIKKLGVWKSYGYGDWGIDNLLVFKMIFEGAFIFCPNAVLYKRLEADAKYKYSADTILEHLHEIQGYFNGYRKIIQNAAIPQIAKDLTTTSVAVKEASWYARIIELTALPDFKMLYQTVLQQIAQKNFIYPKENKGIDSDRPLISIGLALYNSSRFIKKLLASILNQIYTNFELIIIDDHSTDNTLDIVREFNDSRIKLHVNETNQGAEMTHEFVLNNAQGTFFIWAGHDDYWEPDFLFSLLSTMIQYPDTVLAYSQVKIVDENNTVVREYAHFDKIGVGDTVIERLHSYLWTEEGAGKANLIHGLIKTSAIKRAGSFKTYGFGDWGTDNLLVFKLILEGTFKFVPQTFMNKRQLPEQRYMADVWIDHYHEIQGYMQGYRRIIEESALDSQSQDFLLISIAVREGMLYSRLLKTKSLPDFIIGFQPILDYLVQPPQKEESTFEATPFQIPEAEDHPLKAEVSPYALSEKLVSEAEKYIKGLHEAPLPAELSFEKDNFAHNDTTRLKIGFFSLPKYQHFLKDILIHLEKENDVRTCFVHQKDPSVIELIKWADIIFLEWANEMAIHITNQPELIDNKRVILRLHSYEVFNGFAEKINWHKVDHLILVAQHIKDILLDQVKEIERSNTQIQIIPNAIDITQYQFKIRTNGKNIAYFGRVNYKKGPMLLLHAFHALIKKDPSYRLFIGGNFQDIRYTMYYKQMIKEMGLSGYVQYDDWITDINSWLDDKNYIICTSVLEGHPVGIMEAMACGVKPLIHNFVGAAQIYPKKYIWNTIDDFVTLATEDVYDSNEYRTYVADNYNLPLQIEAMSRVFQKNAIVTTEKSAF